MLTNDTPVLQSDVLLTRHQVFHWQRWASVAALCLAVVFACIALGTTTWMSVKVTILGKSEVMELGLFSNCLEDTCRPNDYSTYNMTCPDGTSWSSEPFEARVNATAAMVILTFVFALFAMLSLTLSVFLSSRAPLLLRVTLACTLLSLVTSFIGVVLYAQTMTSWVFCGEGWCYFMTKAASMFGISCTSGLDMSYYFLVVALGLDAVTVVLLVCMNVLLRAEPGAQGGVQEGAPSSTVSGSQQRAPLLHQQK